MNSKRENSGGISETSPTPADCLWTKEQAARYIGITVRTLELWLREKRLPYYKIKRTVRLRREDVLDHLAAHNKVI
jgi:excisionase family DNA binding protein